MASPAENIKVSDAEWAEYKEKFNKTYKDASDEKVHRENYEKNKVKVEEHNKKYESGEVTFSMGINNFSDMSKEEHGSFRGCIDLKNKKK